MTPARVHGTSTAKPRLPPERSQSTAAATATPCCRHTHGPFTLRPGQFYNNSDVFIVRPSRAEPGRAGSPTRHPEFVVDYKTLLTGVGGPFPAAICRGAGGQEAAGEAWPGPELQTHRSADCSCFLVPSRLQSWPADNEVTDTVCRMLRVGFTIHYYIMLIGNIAAA